MAPHRNVGPRRVNLYECAFGPPAPAQPAGTSPAGGLDAAWLAGAELLSVETELLGAFTKKVQTEFLVPR